MPKATRRAGLDVPVRQARLGLIPGKRARKTAVKAIRDGIPIPELVHHMVVTRQWLHKWWNRWRANGKTWQSLEDKSSRPHTIHAKRHAHTEAVLQAKQQYPHLGAENLVHVAGLELSHDTVHRILKDHGLTRSYKTRSWHWKRFQRPKTNDLWQLDITQTRLARGQVRFIATVIDDHSRFVLASRIYEQDPTTSDMLQLVRTTIHTWGKPGQVLTDRGAQFHTNSDYASLFTTTLHELGILHIRARPRHPRTLGKLERWHRTTKEWLKHQPRPPTTSDLRALLDAWLDHYNQERPHTALDRRVPSEAFMNGLKTENALHRFVNGVS